MSPYDPLLTSPASISQSSPERGAKKFVCTWQGCVKSFTRSEHLHRHALNHKEGDHTCRRCAAHFRRRDLLDRHMLRHMEKDKQAGGEGLGNLATRKRLWRDSDGNIVNARRPRNQQSVKKHQPSTSKETPKADTQLQDGIFKIPLSTPELLPKSIPNPEFRNNAQESVHSIMGDMWAEMDISALQPNDVTETSDFLFNASWGTQPLPPTGEYTFDLSFGNNFKPDTAMSFNAPFTTLDYYSWLFEDEGPSPAENTFRQPALSAQIPINGDFLRSNITEEFQSNTGLHRQKFSLDKNAASHVGESSQGVQGRSEGNSLVPNASVNQRSEFSPEQQTQQTSLVARRSPGQTRFTGPEQQSNHVQSTVGQVLHNDQRLRYPRSNASSTQLSPATFEKSTSQSSFSGSQGQQTPTIFSTSQVSTPAIQRSLSMTRQTFPDAYAIPDPAKLPLITKQARDGLIQIITEAHPKKPNGSEISSDHSLLSLPSLQLYSDLFFTRFNSSYPLIHQATFQSDRIHALLLMAILLLGATYSNKEAHLLAVCLHDIMRPVIHASKDFSTRPELWMLQTILLVECFGKSRAGEKQHDMSHLYHGLLINLIRRSDCQSACISPFDEKNQDLEDYWRSSVEAEQKRRLALLCFMWDTQHAVLFSQSLCMNASELKISLPWDNAIWQANSSSEWLRLTENSPSPPQYLSVLKMYTNPSATTIPTHLNALSRVLILHGLMSISWDFNRRDQTSQSLSITSSSIPWRARMSSCYGRWKDDYEEYNNAVLQALSYSQTEHAKFLRFSVANMAVYHTAQLILDVDIIDLQIHAGACNIIGRLVSDADRERSRANIAKWISRDGAKTVANSTWHAARLLRDGVRQLKSWNVDEMFHYPWCLYLGTLMCWIFHDAAARGSPAICDPSTSFGADATETRRLSLNPTSSSSSSSMSTFDERTAAPMHNDGLNNEDSDWDARVEMIALISGLTKLNPAKGNFVTEMWDVALKHETQGLLKCMVKHLKTVRWAVVRQGMIVLEGLPN